jgi:hypothetical protein
LIINYESNYIFEKVPVDKKAPKVSSLKEVLVKELKKDQPLSASVDSNGPETIET